MHRRLHIATFLMSLLHHSMPQAVDAHLDASCCVNAHPPSLRTVTMVTVHLDASRYVDTHLRCFTLCQCTPSISRAVSMQEWKGGEEL